VLRHVILFLGTIFALPAPRAGPTQNERLFSTPVNEGITRADLTTLRVGVGVSLHMRRVLFTFQVRREEQHLLEHPRLLVRISFAPVRILKDGNLFAWT